MIDQQLSRNPANHMSSDSRRVVSRHGFLQAFLLTLALCVLKPTASAQVTTADVVGTVTDSTSAILPNVTVSLRSLDTNIERKAQSTSAGDYTFTLLAPGRYTLTVSVSGYKTFNSTVSVAAGDRARLNAILSLGDVTETVNVQSASPALQSDSSFVGATITEKSVQDLPLNGRNFTSLAQITAGSNEGPPKGLSSGAGTGDRRPSTDMAVNGQADLVNNEMIDDMDNNERLQGTIGVHPSIDSIAELRVITNLYPAEISRTAGGVIEIVTKSGTNQFHGSVYEYFRNDALNAAYYQFGAHNRKPELRQNQFGGSLGGPIFHDRTFFFADYEGLRLNQGGAPTSVTVPTFYEEQHVGDFSDVGGTVYTSAQLDPVGVNYFKLYPAPNVGASSYVGTQVNRTKSATADTRVDHKLNDNNSIFVRYSYNGFTELLPPLLPVAHVAGLSIYPTGSNAQTQAHNGQIDYVHSFSPNFLMNLKAGFLGIYINETQLNYGTAVNTAFGEPNVNIDAGTSGLGLLSVTGSTPLGNAGNFLPTGITDNAFQYLGSATYIHGAHTIKVGASLIRRQSTDAGSQYGAGNFTVSSFANLAIQGIFSASVRNYEISRAFHLRTWEIGTSCAGRLAHQQRPDTESGRTVRHLYSVHRGPQPYLKLQLHESGCWRAGCRPERRVEHGQPCHAVRELFSALGIRVLSQVWVRATRRLRFDVCSREPQLHGIPAESAVLLYLRFVFLCYVPGAV